MTLPSYSKHFTSSILLWMRTDKPRSAGMDHWSGPHSQIIANTPGLHEYRQIHMEEDNPGRWPHTQDIETTIPADRKIDGVAEVTQGSLLAPLKGRKQTALAFEDEVNVFRRTLYYGGLPGTSRWYDVAPGEKASSRAMLYLRRREGIRSATFNKALKRDIVPALAATGALKELRTQTFLPWSKKMWDTPHVAHDNPQDQHLHASIILGFASDEERATFFTPEQTTGLNPLFAPVTSAIHAYDVESARTFVRNGEKLLGYEI